MRLLSLAPVDFIDECIGVVHDTLANLVDQRILLMPHSQHLFGEAKCQSVNSKDHEALSSVSARHSSLPLLLFVLSSGFYRIIFLCIIHSLSSSLSLLFCSRKGNDVTL